MFLGTVSTSGRLVLQKLHVQSCCTMYMQPVCYEFVVSQRVLLHFIVCVCVCVCLCVLT